MFHFHGFHCDQFVAKPDLRTRFYINRYNPARHGGAETTAIVMLKTAAEPRQVLQAERALAMQVNMDIVIACDTGKAVKKTIDGNTSDRIVICGFEYFNLVTPVINSC